MDICHDIFPDVEGLYAEFSEVIELWISVTDFDFVSVQICEKILNVGSKNLSENTIEGELELDSLGKIKITAMLTITKFYEKKQKQQFELLLSILKNAIENNFLNEVYDYDAYKTSITKLESELEFYKFSAMSDFRANCYNDGYYYKIFEKQVDSSRGFSTALFRVKDSLKTEVIIGSFDWEKLLVEFTKMINDLIGSKAEVCKLNYNTIAAIGENFTEEQYREVILKLHKLVGNSKICSYQFESAYLEYKGNSRADYLWEILDGLE